MPRKGQTRGQSSVAPDAEECAIATSVVQEWNPNASAREVRRLVAELTDRIAAARRAEGGVTVSASLRVSGPTLADERRRQRQQEGGRQRGLHLKQQALELSARIAEKASAYRATKPYHRHRAPTHALITSVAGDLETSPETVRGHLRGLGLK